MTQDSLIIGFSKSKGFKPFSIAIQLFDDTKYSHTYLKLANKHFNDYDIYQASKGLVNHVVEKTFLEENEIIAEFSIPIESAEKLKLINLIRYKLGKPYSISTVLGIFLARFGIHWKRFFDNENAYICSELVAKVLKSSEKIPMDIDVDKATPKQLYELCDLYTTRIK
jgi:hypothetical protein